MTDAPTTTTARRRELLPAGAFSAASLACFLLVAAVGLTADLWLKSWSWQTFVADVTTGEDGKVSVWRNNLNPDPTGLPRYDITVVPHGLDLTAVANQGAAMGLGQGQRTLFLVVSVAAVATLFYFFAFSGGRRLYQAVLGLLLAGVLGNLYDRVTYGYVRDMLHAFPGVRWSDLIGSLPSYEVFPWVFNLADVYLCVGVPAVLLYGMFADAAARREQQAAAEPAAGAT